MRVLVTGASGFLGGVTCDRAIAAGHEVLALVRRPGSEPPGTTAVHGDLTDADALGRAVGDAVPTSSSTSPPRSPPSATASASARSTWRDRALLEACRAAGLRGSCHLDGRDRRCRRAHSDRGPAAAGLDPYGASKRECERLLAESGLPYVTIRPSHVYGPGAGMSTSSSRCSAGRAGSAWSGTAGTLGRRPRRRRRHGAPARAGRAPERRDLPLRRRRADGLLRLHGAHREHSRVGRPRRIPRRAGSAGGRARTPSTRSFVRPARATRS